MVAFIMDVSQTFCLIFDIIIHSRSGPAYWKKLYHKRSEYDCRRPPDEKTKLSAGLSFDIHVPVNNRSIQWSLSAHMLYN